MWPLLEFFFSGLSRYIYWALSQAQNYRASVWLFWFDSNVSNAPTRPLTHIFNGIHYYFGLALAGIIFNSIL